MRSAIRHLVRCHNWKGWSHNFDQEICLLWKGFTRSSDSQATKSIRRVRKARTNTNQDIKERIEPDADVNDDNNSDDNGGDESDEEELENYNDQDEFKVGKVPMTPELYRKVCLWCLEWGMLDGLFGALFFCMTWNLVCRSNNTARIRFSHMSWTVFDALTINFWHTKTQQHGEAKQQKWACYSNPFEYYSDLPFLLGLWLSCGFTFKQSQGHKLFPGSAKSQATQAGNILQRVLKEHEAEVLAMGYDKTSDLGLHSIHKGVVTHLASLPGGPPPAAVCLCGGWSMGQVKDSCGVGEEFQEANACGELSFEICEV